MKQFQQTYSISVDQEDGFGFGGCFTKEEVYSLLKEYIEATTEEYDRIIEDGGVDTDEFDISIVPLAQQNAEQNLSIKQLTKLVHDINVKSGWWTDINTGESLESKQGEQPKRNVPEMLCLVHSEVSEAMEGFRKNLMDDKLPHRQMLEVELADAVIRILDMCGGLGLDLEGAIFEKLAYNAQREDHKVENRLKENGKKF